MEIKMSLPIKINLLAGPSAGKSMIAALIFGNLKLKGVNCELVSEWAKELVWRGWDMKISKKETQLSIFLHQLEKEEILLDKVSHIVTDSPLVLNAFYSKSETLKEMAQERITENDYFFWLTRVQYEFQKEGRIHSEKESLRIEQAMKSYMEDLGIKIVVVDCPLEERANWIIDYVQKDQESRLKK